MRIKNHDTIEGRPVWLKAAQSRVCGMPWSCGLAIQLACNLLADIEADDLPSPGIRSYGGSVIIEWRHPEDGSRLEITCHPDGTTQIAPWSDLIATRVLTCKHWHEAAVKARTWISWVCPQFGATRKEMEALCEVA